MKKQYRSDIMASVHETAEGLQEAGLMDQRTMREFDELCLTSVSVTTPADVRSIHGREPVNQSRIVG